MNEWTGFGIENWISCSLHPFLWEFTINFFFLEHISIHQLRLAVERIDKIKLKKEEKCCDHHNIFNHFSATAAIKSSTLIYAFFLDLFHLFLLFLYFFSSVLFYSFVPCINIIIFSTRRVMMLITIKYYIYAFLNCRIAREKEILRREKKLEWRHFGAHT